MKQKQEPPKFGAPVSQVMFCCSTCLWEERSKANVREGRVCSRTDIVVAGCKGRLNILGHTEVRKDVVWIVQVRSVINLEQTRISLSNSDVAEERVFRGSAFV